MYGKLFAQMYDGTLGTKGPWQALVTFQQMIVLADKEGVVDMTADALSRRTTIPLDIITLGLAELEKADAESRTPDEEGKRIMRVSEDRPWGWRIVNYDKYRQIRTAEERRAYQREYWRSHRSPTALNRKLNNSTDTTQSQPIVEVNAEVKVKADTTHTHAEQFERAEHRTAYLEARSAARNPSAFDASLSTLHQPITGGAAYSWEIIGQAILEVAGNGSVPTINAVRSFCRKLAAPEPAAKPNGSLTRTRHIEDVDT